MSTPHDDAPSVHIHIHAHTHPAPPTALAGAPGSLERRLLVDLLDLLDDTDRGDFTVADAVQLLQQWEEWECVDDGRPITPQWVGQLLRPLGITVARYERGGSLLQYDELVRVEAILDTLHGLHHHPRPHRREVPDVVPPEWRLPPPSDELPF